MQALLCRRRPTATAAAQSREAQARHAAWMAGAAPGEAAVVDAEHSLLVSTVASRWLVATSGGPSGVALRPTLQVSPARCWAEAALVPALPRVPLLMAAREAAGRTTRAAPSKAPAAQVMVHAAAAEACPAQAGLVWEMPEMLWRSGLCRPSGTSR